MRKYQEYIEHLFKTLKIPSRIPRCSPRWLRHPDGHTESKQDVGANRDARGFIGWIEYCGR